MHSQQIGYPDWVKAGERQDLHFLQSLRGLHGMIGTWTAVGERGVGHGQTCVAWVIVLTHEEL